MYRRLLSQLAGQVVKLLPFLRSINHCPVFAFGLGLLNLDLLRFPIESRLCRVGLIGIGFNPIVVIGFMARSWNLLRPLNWFHLIELCLRALWLGRLHQFLVGVLVRLVLFHRLSYLVDGLVELSIFRQRVLPSGEHRVQLVDTRKRGHHVHSRDRLPELPNRSELGHQHLQRDGHRFSVFGSELTGVEPLDVCLLDVLLHLLRRCSSKEGGRVHFLLFRWHLIVWYLIMITRFFNCEEVFTVNFVLRPQYKFFLCTQYSD